MHSIHNQINLDWTSQIAGFCGHVAAVPTLGHLIWLKEESRIGEEGGKVI